MLLIYVRGKWVNCADDQFDWLQLHATYEKAQKVPMNEKLGNRWYKRFCKFLQHAGLRCMRFTVSRTYYLNDTDVSTPLYNKCHMTSRLRQRVWLKIFICWKTEYIWNTHVPDQPNLPDVLMFWSHLTWFEALFRRLLKGSHSAVACVDGRHLLPITLALQLRCLLSIATLGWCCNNLLRR